MKDSMEGISRMRKISQLTAMTGPPELPTGPGLVYMILVLLLSALPRFGSVGVRGKQYMVSPRFRRELLLPMLSLMVSVLSRARVRRLWRQPTREFVYRASQRRLRSDFDQCLPPQ